MPKWIERIPVDSETSDATYIVGISDEGEYGCSCPHWKFRRQECKHIRSVRTGAMKRLTAAATSLSAPAPKSPPPDFTARPRRMIQLEDD